MNETTVLMVDDDHELLEFARIQIEAAGFHFIGLSEAETLLQVFHTQQPDIILMDIQLPGVNGIHIIEKLRQLPDANICKILYISSHDKESYINQAFAVGADDYILKPVNWLILINRLQHMARDIARQKRINILANTFKNASEGMMITDDQARIIEVNDSFTRITGYSQDEMLSNTPAILSSGHHAKPFYQTMWQQLETEGHWSGEIWNKRKDGHVYPEWLSINAIYGRGGRISNFIGVFTDISRIKENEAQLLKQANQDSLTGLPNRLLLIDRIQQVINRTYREHNGVAILFIDLDGFKDINDHYGHEAGDRVLVELAQRYQSALRREDTVARFGGDEFVVLVSNLKNHMEAELIAEKILKETQQPIYLDNCEARVGCSIGIAVEFEALENAEQLIGHADEAMYQAKRSGKNRYVTYKP